MKIIKVLTKRLRSTTVQLIFFCCFLVLSSVAWAKCGYVPPPEFASRKIISIKPAFCVCFDEQSRSVKPTNVIAKNGCRAEVEVKTKSFWKSTENRTFGTTDKRICAMKSGEEAKSDFIYSGAGCNDTGSPYSSNELPSCEGAQPNPETCKSELNLGMAPKWIRLGF